MNPMLVLCTVAFVAHFAWSVIRYAPMFVAVAMGVDDVNPSPRHRVLWGVTAFPAAIAWAYMMSCILEVLYV